MIIDDLPKLVVKLLLIIIITTSCSSKKQEKAYNEETNQLPEDKLRADKFFQYLESIRELHIPFTINNIDEEPTGYNLDLFVKFKHEFSRWPYGRIMDNDEFVTIIEVSVGEDRYYPVIMTYTKDGQKVDSLFPHKKSGWDIDYLSKEYVTIDENQEIIVTDSTTTWDLSDDMGRIDDSKVTSTDTVIYKVDEFGKFVIIKGKVEE